MLEDLNFLGEGEYTKKDEKISKIARELKKSNKNYLMAISNYVSGLEYKPNNFLGINLFRGRSASTILKSRFVTGCTDNALAFIVLARELGIPTKYVETISEEWLQKNNSEKIQGHVFAEVFFDGIWRKYEPEKGFTPHKDYIINEKRYIEIGNGLDFSEVYLKENGNS